MADRHDASEEDENKLQSKVERSQFGVSKKPKNPVAEEFRAPMNSSELSKGPEELTEQRGTKVNWRVFIISSVLILAFSAWAMFAPDNAASTMANTVAWISTNLGWYYVLTVTLVVLFVLWVAFSKEGSVRLGPDHSRPQYNLVTWVAMLFAAGVGIDMLFYSVTGPITQFITPPAADPESAAAAQDAVVWTMFHYGVAGWSMYALLGMAMGYFAYRWECRYRSVQRFIHYWANASVGPPGMLSTFLHWSARSLVWRPPWVSAWFCSTLGLPRFLGFLKDWVYRSPWLQWPW